jgi:hypothetical protein
MRASLWLRASVASCLTALVASVRATQSHRAPQRHVNGQRQVRRCTRERHRSVRRAKSHVRTYVHTRSRTVRVRRRDVARVSDTLGPLVAPGVEVLTGGEGARTAKAAQIDALTNVAAREVSGTAFEGLSPTAAEATIQQAFSGIVHAPNGGPPPLAEGQKTVGYPSDYAMAAGRGTGPVFVPDAMEDRGMWSNTTYINSEECGYAVMAVG